jgi:hypothetical protein
LAKRQQIISGHRVVAGLFQEASMGQKSEPPGFDQVYVLKIDQNGNTRGARFNMLKDSIVSAAMDMNCRVLIRQPESVSALGMRLPIGVVFGTSKIVKLFIPTIDLKLYKSVLQAVQVAAKRKADRIEGTNSYSIH